MNQRNLLVLEALDRVRRIVLQDEATDPEPTPLSGDGTLASPFEIPGLPFVDDGDTSKSASRLLAGYGCSAANETGPEIVYKVTLAQQTKVQARVYEDANVDVDLHWLSAPDAAHCVARANTTLDVDAPAGTYWLVIDTFVDAAGEHAGTFRLTVVTSP
jgi:hypothetical protein